MGGRLLSGTWGISRECAGVYDKRKARESHMGKAKGGLTGTGKGIVLRESQEETYLGKASEILSGERQERRIRGTAREVELRERHGRSS